MTVIDFPRRRQHSIRLLEHEEPAWEPVWLVVRRSHVAAKHSPRRGNSHARMASTSFVKEGIAP